MDEESKKECAFCGRDAVLALFGVGIGVVFILMGLDTLRRMRKETSGSEPSFADGESE